MGSVQSQKSWGKFCEVFGVTPRNRILEFFLEMRELDFPIGEVAKEIGLSRATAYAAMEELLREMYLIPSRKVSGGQLYRLDLGKEEVQLLIQSFQLILQGIVHEHQGMEMNIRTRKAGGD